MFGQVVYLIGHFYSFGQVVNLDKSKGERALMLFLGKLVEIKEFKC